MKYSKKPAVGEVLHLPLQHETFLTFVNSQVFQRFVIFQPENEFHA